MSTFSFCGVDMRSIYKDFIKYVSLNILGMIGLSGYILADTFFVSKALGSAGIASLNLSISIFSLINGTGLMIGIGGAAGYGIYKSQGKNRAANRLFTHAMVLGLLVGIVFGVVGAMGSNRLALLLGADAMTLPMTQTYLTTILCFSPCFIMNNILLAFLRNDNNLNLSMIAMLSGSIFNVIMDYVFMFPLNMGMFGAALATGLAPIVSMAVMSFHFTGRKNSLKLIRSKMLSSNNYKIIRFGISSFITEVSSAVVLIAFNLVILGIEGNLGVAAYGIIANISLVCIAVFTGIAHGIQPLASKWYGSKNQHALNSLIKLSLLFSLLISGLLYGVLFFKADLIVDIFNSEHQATMAAFAGAGIRIYFTGIFFAAVNIVFSAYLSATGRTRNAFAISVMRGCIIIVPMVLILSRMLMMTGVWLSFVLTECVVVLISALINHPLFFRKVQRQ